MLTEGGNGTAKERKERLRRRLVAARTLAGLGQKELAEKIKAMGHRRGFSARTIGDMERGETPIQPQAIPVLAEACGLPPEFFTVDFETLRETEGRSRIDKLEDRLAAVERQLATPREGPQTPRMPSIPGQSEESRQPSAADPGRTASPAAAERERASGR